jgi:hypothetical protein
MCDETVRCHEPWHIKVKERDTEMVVISRVVRAGDLQFVSCAAARVTLDSSCPICVSSWAGMETLPSAPSAPAPAAPHSAVSRTDHQKSRNPANWSLRERSPQQLGGGSANSTYICRLQAFSQWFPHWGVVAPEPAPAANNKTQRSKHVDAFSLQPTHANAYATSIRDNTA